MINSILIVYNPYHEVQLLPDIKDFLKQNKKKFKIIGRDSISPDDYADKDLVLVIGGDGTFLRASHFNKDVPMLGINPNPDTKEGFYMKANLRDFREKLLSVFSGDYSVIDLLRLNAKINSHLLPEAILNEAYIGGSKPYTVFNYDLSAKDASEFQRGSGVLVGTPSGSSAWLNSSGGLGLGIEDRKFQFVARELYEGRHTRDYKMHKGVLPEGQSLVITPKSEGIVVIDSISQEYGFKKGDRIEISVHPHSLKYVMMQRD